MPRKKENQNKDKSIFDKAFGRSFETVDPGKGVEPVKIDSASIGNIPGAMEHWRKEIERRKKDIVRYENRGFFERVFDWVDDDEFEDASGDELYDIFPSDSLEKLMDRREDDPSEMGIRLEMVARVINSNKEFSIETHRDLFLQATVACCFGELSTTGLKTVFWTQQTYFAKLQQKSKEDLSKLERILEESKGTSIYARHLNLIKSYIQQIRGNIELIKFYLSITAQGAKWLSSSLPAQLTLDEINSNVGNARKKFRKHGDDLFKKAFIIISALRFSPLLHDEAKKYLDLLAKVDPQDPVTDLMSGRMNRIKLLYHIQHYQAGDRSTTAVKIIRDRFALAHQSYQNAVKKLKHVSKSPRDSIILVEFARLIYDYYKFFEQVLRMKLPREWAVDYLTKADAALEKAVHAKDTRELRIFIQRAIAEAK